VEHSNSSLVATWVLPDIDQYMAPVAERSSKYATWLDTDLLNLFTIASQLGQCFINDMLTTDIFAIFLLLRKTLVCQSEIFYRICSMPVITGTILLIT